MGSTMIYQNVHGVEAFVIDMEDHEPGKRDASRHERRNISVIACTVQKTKQWIGELMQELQWDDASKTYHGLRAVLHALRDRLTIAETADLAAQLPMLLRGMYYECWQPSHVPVKDHSKEEFLSHIVKAFPDDPNVDPERLTHAVLKVVAALVSEGETDDIRSIVPKPLVEPLDSVDRQEFRPVFQACLKALPERQSRVFMLREIEDLETGEICKELEISASNLWGLLHRARLRLANCIKLRWL
ncbi:sigma-70 family RNA polymerase sigma factor [Neorhodopirellula lusitana]|uniref:sigma-70 family RNA polymerase sigma factor n=1 Tax=Neorhodopirellula lusitana TaxID=445327 RepID=UPI00384F804F